MRTASEKKDGVHPIFADGNPERVFLNKTHIPGVGSLFTNEYVGFIGTI
jgi:hypothetical protein